MLLLLPSLLLCLLMSIVLTLLLNEFLHLLLAPALLVAAILFFVFLRCPHFFA